MSLMLMRYVHFFCFWRNYFWTIYLRCIFLFLFQKSTHWLWICDMSWPISFWPARAKKVKVPSKKIHSVRTMYLSVDNSSSEATDIELSRIFGVTCKTLVDPAAFWWPIVEDDPSLLFFLQILHFWMIPLL